MGSFKLPVLSEEDLAAVSVACILAGVGLCFFSYRWGARAREGRG